MEIDLTGDDDVEVDDISLDKSDPDGDGKNKAKNTSSYEPDQVDSSLSEDEKKGKKNRVSKFNENP